MNEAVVTVNVFTPKPGKLDEFIEVQRTGLRRLIGDTPPAGWRGGRLYRGKDGKTAVLVSVFDSEELQKRFMERSDFIEHRQRLAALVDRAEPRQYQLVHEAGQI